MRMPLDVPPAGWLAGPMYVHLNTVSRHFGAETKIMTVHTMVFKPHNLLVYSETLL